MPHHTALYHAILWQTILRCAVLYYKEVYFIVLSIILYYTVRYTILYSTITHCTTRCYTALPPIECHTHYISLYYSVPYHTALYYTVP